MVLQVPNWAAKSLGLTFGGQFGACFIRRWFSIMLNGMQTFLWDVLAMLLNIPSCNANIYGPQQH